MIESHWRPSSAMLFCPSWNPGTKCCPGISVSGPSGESGRKASVLPIWRSSWTSGLSKGPLPGVARVAAGGRLAHLDEDLTSNSDAAEPGRCAGRGFAGLGFVGSDGERSRQPLHRLRSGTDHRTTA